MLSIAVCDDNEFLATKMHQDIKSIAEAKGVSCEVEIFHDGQDIVSAITEGSRFDLIFLDIEMEHLGGLEAAKEIREVDKTTLIICISSHAEYALEAYAIRPFNFLVKPLPKDELEKQFDAALEQILSDEIYFHFNDGRKSLRVPIKDIVYFESALRVINIICVDKTYTFKERMNTIENALNQTKADFWRIHQSYLVSRRHIYKMSYTEIELSNGTTLPISEGRRKEIRERYIEKIGNNMID